MTLLLQLPFDGLPNQKEGESGNDDNVQTAYMQSGQKIAKFPGTSWGCAGPSSAANYDLVVL